MPPMPTGIAGEASVPVDCDGRPLLPALSLPTGATPAERNASADDEGRSRAHAPAHGAPAMRALVRVGLWPLLLLGTTVYAVGARGYSAWWLVPAVLLALFMVAETPRLGGPK